VPFVCECADERCLQIISIPLDEFDGIVASGAFLTFPGHRRPTGQAPGGLTRSQ
jgi:hypothetical protein